MKILQAKVNIYPDFDNLPGLSVLVDKLPSMDSLVYEEKNFHYFAEKDGYVNFYFYQSPGEGYGGRTFTINTKDGKKDLIGPWSSNANSMTNQGFPETVEVSITDDPKVMERGYTFYSGHLTLDKFQEACKLAKCSVAKNKYGYCAMPYCECGFPYTQKYRISLPLTKEKTIYNMGRKVLCAKCIKGYTLNINPISMEVLYLS